MRAFLTVGGGFIGSNTALALLENGYEVIIYDSFINCSSMLLIELKPF
tara:strand:- start:193 stop:336 length:144 start_codon:yes stop_codon:yes gene_type:complete